MTSIISKQVQEIKSEKDGYIQEINAEKIGELSCFLGAGRINKEDGILQDVGIILNKKVGDKVNNGDILAKIYADNLEKMQEAKRKLFEIYIIDKNIPVKDEAILKIV